MPEAAPKTRQQPVSYDRLVLTEYGRRTANKLRSRLSGSLLARGAKHPDAEERAFAIAAALLCYYDIPNAYSLARMLPPTRNLYEWAAVIEEWIDQGLVYQKTER